VGKSRKKAKPALLESTADELERELNDSIAQSSAR
jgi:hypothetical protein